MTSHLRRLLLPPDHDPSLITNISSPSPPPPPSQIKERDDPTTSSGYSTTCCFSSLKLNPPFDSAMALTVLVLLIALFMMGFFSIYIRRFADESSVDPTRRRGRGRRRGSEVGSATSYLGRSKKGVDPKMVGSLPVHAYDGGGAKHGLECAICLSEFEEREWVKEIPYCGHVFHVECIDTWLSTHVTCPLCRTARLFTGDEDEDDAMAEAVAEQEEEERGLGVSEVQESDGGRELRIEVEEGDRRNENGGERDVGSIGARSSTSTSTSCSRAEERERLHR